MKKVLIVVIAVILTVAFALSVDSIASALFNMVSKGADNQLQAGTLQVEVIGDPVDISGITPGTSGEANFEVRNTGTLPAVYMVNLETSGGLFEGNNPVQAYVSDGGSIEPGAVGHIAVKWIFPEAAGNEYQGATGTFAVVINAQQDVGAYPVK